MNWLAKLLCFHRGGVSFVRNIYGDEIIACGGKRSIWKCKRCGSHLFEPYLNPPIAATPPEQTGGGK